MPISISGPSIVRYFLEKKVYWAVFFAEFGLDLKIVRYLMGGINHTACMPFGNTWATKKKMFNGYFLLSLIYYCQDFQREEVDGVIEYY